MSGKHGRSDGAPGAGSKPPSASRARSLMAILAAAAAAAIGLSACGDQALAAGSAVTTAASPAASVVDVHKLPGYGKVLVTGTGMSLYTFTKDPPMASDCKGYCVQAWPPLVVKGPVKAGPGAATKLLATAERPGGQDQVFYAKHALYTYIRDARPGMTVGEGVKNYGGTWWLVSPSGKPVTGPTH